MPSFISAVWSVDRSLLMCGLWEEGEWQEEMQERIGEPLGEGREMSSLEHFYFLIYYYH